MPNKHIHIKDKRKNENTQAHDSRGQLPAVRAVRYQELGEYITNKYISSPWNTSTLLAFMRYKELVFSTQRSKIPTFQNQGMTNPATDKSTKNKQTHMKTNKLKTGWLPTLNSEITRNTCYPKQTHKETHKSPHTWRQTHIITNKHSYINIL